MKRMIASLVALSVIVAPAVAATTAAAPVKTAKHMKKAKVATLKAKAPAKKFDSKKAG
jgi:1-aminocyclopropane-1-carboxylate deaminase/D-cysteine desulfhydrase-like pyridoxal-dependent ACC family enzyme